MESAIIASILEHNIGYCLLGFPSNESFLIMYFPYCHSFILGSTFLSSLITTIRSLYPIGKPYASLHVLLVSYISSNPLLV